MKGVTWTNLEPFKDQLQTISKTLLEEADGILRDGAEAAKAEIVTAYRRGPTGNLKRGVKIRAARGSWIGGVELKQTAPHGHLYEHGTVVRHTQDGAHRGRMAARPTFGPIAAHHQRLTLILLMATIREHGAATVAGEADVDLGASARLL